MATHRSTIKKKFHPFYYHPSRVAGRKLLSGNVKFQLFRTPLYMLDNLYAGYPSLLSGRILDPCGGDGRYIQFAVDMGNKNKHMLVDINKSELPAWHKNGLLKTLGQSNCYVTDFLEMDLSKKGLFDSVCTNPPFKEARLIVDKCLDHMNKGGTVTVLHRTDWIGTIDRSRWMSKRGLKQMLVIAKRPIWEIDGRSKNVSDTREYSWFVFEKGYTGKPSIEWIL